MGAIAGMSAFAIISGLIGPVNIGIFILAIRLSYAIEARSDPKKAKALFGYTNIWAVALNWRVARDAQTQSMRKRLLVYLAIIAALFAVMAVSYAALGRASAL